MPRIVTALFETRAAAERALQALMETGVARDRIAIVGERHAASTELAPTRPSAPDENVLSALRDLALPGEDTRLFQEGLRRGCALVTVRVDQGDFGQAIQTLEMFDPVDLDRRSAEWLTSGAAAAGAGVDVGGPLGAGLTAGAAAGLSNVSATPGMETLTQDTTALGTADLHTAEMSLSNEGLSAMATGGQRANERAGAPGVTELGAPNREPVPGLGARGVSVPNQDIGLNRGAEPDREAAAALDPSMAGLNTSPGSPAAYSGAEQAAKQSPNAAQTARTGDAEPDYHRREMTGTGRVRSYVRDLG
jgi:hypothetical protein